MSDVTIYTTGLCAYCSRAKEILRSKGISFSEIDVGRNPELRKEMTERARGRRTVPQIFFGDTHVGGCDDLIALTRKGGLEALLDEFVIRRVGLVQLCSGADVAANVASASDAIRASAAEGAQLVATPEMTSLMDARKGMLLAKTVAEHDDLALDAFRKLAAQLGIHLLIGSLPIRVSPEKCANRSFLIGSDGVILARYDKIHMFDVAIGDGQDYRESVKFEPGRTAVLADAGGLRLGLSVCYDLRFPHLYRILAQAGAEMLCVPAAFTRVTGQAHWHVLLRARAIENGAYVIAPAQGGRHEDGRETFGHSLVIGPWGEIVAEAAGSDPQIVLADLDLTQVREARRRIPALGHDRPIEAPAQAETAKLC